MSWSEFFSTAAQVSRSLDNKENWIANVNQAKQIFGEDVFSEFLPVYVGQLRALCASILSPAYNLTVTEDGGSDLMVDDGGELRIDWSMARVPQCEAYFERHHGSAVNVVRSAAQAVLTKLDHATVRHHPGALSLQRRLDLLSIRCELTNKRSLSLYAKAPNRLRFEIVRNTAGRYGGEAVQPGASGRLLTILSAERRQLLTACQWQAVGTLLTEQDEPIVGDLVEFTCRVSEACARAAEDFSNVFTILVTDGGLSEAQASGNLIGSLKESGVLERTHLRTRDGRLPRRYSLTEQHLAMFDSVMSALSLPRGREGSE